MMNFLRILWISLAAVVASPAAAQTDFLPSPTSDKFCQAVQKILASTEIEGTNTIFTDMPSYRHSKPAVDPLMIYQVVTYDGTRPIMVSCKIKGAAHIRAAFGDDKAGEQFYCPQVTRRIKAQAIAELNRDNQLEAAKALEAFVLDENEPFMTGRDYLADFQLSYVDEKGIVHISSPGLFHDFDSWTTWILPENFEGQSYCHLATVDYLTALATGVTEPGTLMTTADDAPTVPR